MRRFILGVAALALAAPAALADEIQLTNGKTLVGIARKDPALKSKVIVEVPEGTIILDEKMVSSINPGRTALHEFEEKRGRLKDSKDVSELWSLAEWARERKLTRYVPMLAERVIAVQPDHAAARAALRHEKKDGTWLTFEQAQEARGLKQVDGRWMGQAERELREKRRVEAQQKAELAKAEREKRKQEELAARRKAYEEAVAWHQARMAGLDGYFHSPSFAFTTPYFRPYWWAPYVRSRSYYQEGWRYNGGVWPTFDMFRFAPSSFAK